MTDPIRVILPPWRRGDGQPCKEPGYYQYRKHHGENVSIRMEVQMTAHDVMERGVEYAGPYEFIETEPEPEPLVLPGHETRVTPLARNLWYARAIRLNEDGDGMVVGVTHESRRIAIEVFNAAVKAMEGKP